MTHRSITNACEAMGMKVRREPDQGRKSFSASYDVAGPRVYWSVSQHTESLLGLPRVTHQGTDTHARTVREIQYLVRRETP